MIEARARRRRFGLALFGFIGVACLVALGVWQTSRAQWKSALIADMTVRLEAPPRVVDGSETPAEDFAPALAMGRFVTVQPEARYLTSQKPLGPGFRLIAPFEIENGVRILVDRGFAPEAEMASLAPPDPSLGALRLSGVLRWPRETNPFTPEPDREALLFFARDVEALAEALGTRPVLLVLGESAALASDGAPAAAPDGWPRPSPVSVDLPNNHVGYAITWYALAVIWLAMTLYAVGRGSRRAAEEGGRE